MARSSSVYRWLQELRYDTESYDTQHLSQPDLISLASRRHGRASWTPITFEDAVQTQPVHAIEMPSSVLETVTNKVRDVVSQKEDCAKKTEHVEVDEPILRRRLATTSITPGIVSANTRRINEQFRSHQTQTSNKFLNVNQNLLLQPSPSLTGTPRPASHQPPTQRTFLHREYSQPQIQRKLTVVKEGQIERVKIATGGIKNAKHWRTGMSALLTDRTLFFADNNDLLLQMKSGAITGGMLSKDRMVDLRGGAQITLDTDRVLSTKRNVFSVTSADGSVTALIQNDNTQTSEIWYKVISEVIAKYIDPAALKINATTATKSALSRFFKKRPPKETLVNQGIYKNEPIFGNTLERLYETSDRKQLVPAFVQRCTEILENPPHVFSQGLYRTSGNLSHIQKLRLRVDQEDAAALDDLSIAADSDVLAGALKLFFRELQVPLVPYQIYLRLSEANSNQDGNQRFLHVREGLKKLSEAHRATLAVLCSHLLRITVYERQNQMSAANLGIVWGPSFTWPDEGSEARALHLCTDVNRLVQYLIEESGTLFK